MLERLPVDETAEWPRRFRNPAREQCPDLVEQPACELLVDATRHSFGNLRRRQPDADGHEPCVRNRRSCARKMSGQRTAGQEVDLERAYDALEIAWLDPERRFTVDPAQHSMQEQHAALAGDR